LTGLLIKKYTFAKHGMLNTCIPYLLGLLAKELTYIQMQNTMYAKLTGFIIVCMLTIIGQMEIKGMNRRDLPGTIQPIQEQIYELKGQETSNVNNRPSKNLGNTTSRDSMYMSRLDCLPTEMDLKFNSVVRDHIEKYAKNGGKYVGSLLGKGEYYFPLFEKVLDSEGVPLELKYLPVIESALNPTARSRAGATGLWQFMSGTAKNYGLEINNQVDERRDPVKSTYAAVKYLKELYYLYQDWYLVIAAYNCGPANVNKAIYRSGGKTDYWEIYPYLPKETRNYVPAFIAATYIMNYHGEHDIVPVSQGYPKSMDSVKVNANIRLQHIANAIGITVDELRKYNPQFKSDVIPGKNREYSLNLPAHKVMAFIENEDAIYSGKKVVRKDEQPENFANVSTLETNKDVYGTSAFNSSMEKREVTKYYKIQKGDNLNKIARKNNVTVAELKKWNKIRPNSLRAGSELKIQTIEYFVVEPRLKAPELLIVSVDDKAKKEIFGNYIDQIKTETDIQKVLVREKASNDMKFLSVVNNIDYRVSRHSTRKKNVIDQFTAFANSTFNSAKDWGDTRLSKLRRDSRPVEYLADDNMPPVPIEENIQQAKPPIIAEIATNLPVSEPEPKSNNYSLVIDESAEKTSFYNTVFNAGSQKVYHKVRIGETITKIASRYNVSKSDIILWNNLTTGMAKVNQRLLIYLPQKENKLAEYPL